jgi:hypothetical protein
MTISDSRTWNAPDEAAVRARKEKTQKIIGHVHIHLQTFGPSLLREMYNALDAEPEGWDISIHTFKGELEKMVQQGLIVKVKEFIGKGQMHNRYNFPEMK